MEYHERRHITFLRHLPPHVFQYREQHIIGCRAGRHARLHAVRLLVFHLYRHLKTPAALHVLAPVSSNLQVAVTLNILAQKPAQHCLTHNRQQHRLVHIRRRAEVLQLLVLVAQHRRRLIAVQDIHDMLRLELLVHLLYRLQHQPQQLRAVLHAVRLPAVVAVAAVVLVVLLAEIVQQQLPPAYYRLRIRLCLKQQLIAYLYLLHGLVFLELAQPLDVFRRVEAYTLPLAAVSARATRLLIVTFQRLRHVVMHHKPHIRLVDTHTERYRRHYHLTLFHQERILISAPLLRVHTRMVRPRGNTVHA